MRAPARGGAALRDFATPLNPSLAGMGWGRARLLWCGRRRQLGGAARRGLAPSPMAACCVLMAICCIQGGPWPSPAVAAPDLVPTTLTPAEGFRNDLVRPSWAVRNNGTAVAIGGWTDSLYLSPSPACC